MAKKQSSRLRGLKKCDISALFPLQVNEIKSQKNFQLFLENL